MQGIIALWVCLSDIENDYRALVHYFFSHQHQIIVNEVKTDKLTLESPLLVQGDQQVL